MSIEQEIAVLTQSTTDLLDAVNTNKTKLDTAVTNAETAVSTATTQVNLATSEKVSAQIARDEAESHKDLAYDYSQSAASAVAYQDLTAIAQTKVETAVDVFVYDTSKDSDGGAWRQRTQHTSWYNETLNTATRGSRKEFPAVAVIVAETNKVTIYDGDDPSMPMWMVFNNEGADPNISFLWSGYPNAITALNGQLVYGRSGSMGVISFLRDGALYIRNAGANSIYDWNGASISERNSQPNAGPIKSTSWLCSGGIVGVPVNDVAMTVLPNAPIDPATGLPIPTIAVATDGGVSVIKDDGTVVDRYHTDNSTVQHVTFDGNVLIYEAYNFYHAVPLFAEDVSAGLTYKNHPDDIWFAPAAVSGSYTGASFHLSGSFSNPRKVIQNSNKIAIANSSYLNRAIVPDTYGELNSLSNFTSSNYNTGWMNGDIKLATLSDTDDTDLVGSELVNSNDFTGWTSGDTNVLNVESDGSVTVNDGNGVSNTFLSSPEITVEVGKTYLITITGNGTSSGLGLYTRATGGPNGYAWNRVFTFTANQTNEQIRLFRYLTYTGTGTITSISIRLAEPDRSVNGNGLQVFGTITKEPVATGADLMAYNSTSSSSYMLQPYNSTLNFGTGDFCVSAWVKDLGTGSTRYLIGRIDDAGTKSIFSMARLTSTSTRQIRLTVDGTFTDTTSGLPIDVWSHVTFTRKDGVLYVYIDGKLDISVSSAGDINASTPLVLFAKQETGGDTGPGIKMALLRISATAPTAEQIEKIYNDEKVLFQDNAKATLYGTSDAVTALAYDEDTDLLHVGTSSGRSVFQGLERVDNTTDAVGTAISAVNGLVVEE